MENSIRPTPKRPTPNGPMVPDSVYSRKRTTSPLSNLQPTMKNHFMSIAKPPKTILMERYNPATSNRISPIVPSSQFHEEDAEFTKSEKPLPEGVYVGKLGRDNYGNLSQRVSSPVFTDVDRYINTKHTDYGPYESEGHWGIYDTDFKGGKRRRILHKTRRYRKSRSARKQRRTRSKCKKTTRIRRRK